MEKNSEGISGDTYGVGSTVKMKKKDMKTY